MFQSGPRRGHSPEPLLERLDRAAAELNPILTVIMIGLVILNLIRVVSLGPYLHLTRADLYASTCSLDTAGAIGSVVVAMPNGGLL